MAVASPALADGQLGVMVDAGLPDGVTGALSYEPAHRVRVHAGIGHNLVGVGIRSGVSARLTEGDIAPSLALELGRYFRADSGFVGDLVSDDEESLDKLSYDYVSALAGVEVRGDKTGFYAQLGVAKVFSNLYLSETMEPGIEVKSTSSLDFYTLSGRLGCFVTF
jgi:hypothetical protein